MPRKSSQTFKDGLQELRITLVAKAKAAGRECTVVEVPFEHDEVPNYVDEFRRLQRRSRKSKAVIR